MKNTLVIIGFFIVAMALYVVWGSLSSRLVLIESTTGSYISNDETENEDDDFFDNEVDPTNINLRPLLEQLAALRATQAENTRSIELILKKLDAIGTQGCITGGCETKLVRREVVYFNHDDARLSPKATQSIDKLLESISSNASVSLRGHADTTGDNQYNHLLSLRRAAAVKRYIENKQHTDNRLNNLLVSIGGTGEESVVKVTEDNVEEASNRIVEILVFE